LLQGKSAIITGSGRGIGRSIAKLFADHGGSVIINDIDADVADATAAEVNSAGGKAVACAGSVTYPEFPDRLVKMCAESFGGIDIIVNNAGAAWGAALAEYPEAGFDKVMDTNVKAMFFLTRDLVPMLERGSRPDDPARVINIGSIDGIKVPSVENYAYAPSKAAVHHLTRVLAVKLGRQGITVNAIAPGPFESQMTKWLLENFQSKIEAECPLGRIGSPPDMAGVAIYLSSRAGAYVNGVVIPVDGGICIT
jgi:NAD(P)-dependent dehydrogenase (short-subunit alcohol dehydrogenase family)